MEQEDLEEVFEEEKKKLKIKYILITIFVSIVVAVIASEISLMYYTNRYADLNTIEKKQTENSYTNKKNISIIADTLENFREVIDANFVGEIDENNMLEQTIKGYVNGLNDEYSEYMTAEEWEEFETVALGNYVGIGIYMGVDKNDNVTVIEPIKDSPAEKVGLKAGDIIVSVNDENVLGVDSEIVSNMIKGEPGTKVKITVAREDEYLDFEIERKEIKVYHVESELLENNIGYIGLITFDGGCTAELKQHYNDLKAKGAKKFILDLRNNNGGLVEEALSMLDLFLPKDQTVLITVDSDGNKEIKKTLGSQTIKEDLVVLVNEYSASAAEIVAGALKENERAELIGTKTYGKGVIQTVFSLQDGSALKLTCEEYFTPKETKINKVGIEPDYVIDLDYENQVDTQLNKAIELLK